VLTIETPGRRLRAALRANGYKRLNVTAAAGYAADAFGDQLWVWGGLPGGVEQAQRRVNVIQERLRLVMMRNETAGAVCRRRAERWREDGLYSSPRPAPRARARGAPAWADRRPKGILPRYLVWACRLVGGRPRECEARYLGAVWGVADEIPPPQPVLEPWQLLALALGGLGALVVCVLHCVKASKDRPAARRRAAAARSRPPRRGFERIRPFYQGYAE
jgi:hypothetical protein